MDASSHFEETAARYETVAQERPEFAERFSIFKRRIDAAWEQTGEKEAIAVDLGCGSGDLSWYLAARGFRTVAVDGSAAMLERARRQAEGHGIDGVTFLRRALPLSHPSDVVAPGSATLVVASSVLEYIEHDQVVLDQCGALLGPGGRALISFPNRHSVYWRLQRVLKETPLFRHSDSYHQRHQYAPGVVRKSAARAGLAVSDVEYYALPLQRKLPPSWHRRPPWAAMMFLATLTRAPDAMGQ